jgi:hypothetical protein
MVTLTPEQEVAHAVTIAALNDEMRQFLVYSGQNIINITAGIAAAIDDVRVFANFEKRAALFRLIRDFNDFDLGNDPHCERDFGAVEWEGITVFFKIDYYDLSLQYLSSDATNPDVTRRVMTIMRADEY